MQVLDGRRGSVFSVRVTDDERKALEAAWMGSSGPRALGPWLVWKALGDRQGTTAPSRSGAAVVPLRMRSSGTTRSSTPAPVLPRRRRLILDLCAGSGAWSEAYKRAGYPVVRVTLPKRDVRTFVPPPGVWGVLAAPPCTEFSLAKNGHARDFVSGMECVNACLRIILQARPTWWALENPVGKLSMWLGTPRDVFEPCDFGDPWTKRTALWGTFTKPVRGPYVKPAAGKLRIARTSADRAVTPEGFARAFFESNP